MANKNDKIITKTNHKVIIKMSRISEVLDENEVALFKNLIKKITDKESGK